MLIRLQCSNCTIDFIPVHWYGNFEGFASHIGQVNATYQNISSIWVTEYADAEQDLDASQDFYNQSSSFLNRVPYVRHSSYCRHSANLCEQIHPALLLLWLFPLGRLECRSQCRNADPEGRVDRHWRMVLGPRSDWQHPQGRRC